MSKSPLPPTFSKLAGPLFSETEIGEGTRSAKAFLSPLVDELKSFSPKILAERQSRVDRLAKELGIHFSQQDPSLIRDRNWQLDIIPRVINPKEWDRIENGLLQRTAAFNALLADLYGKQEILKAGVLPFELIFNDPAYLLTCQGIHQPGGYFITLGAIDLVRDREGRWMISNQQFSLPAGLSFVLQNRRMLTQAFPEIFSSLPIEPVTSFSSELAEALAALSPESKPLVVMITRSGDHQNLFEETFLARRMGIPLVDPGDLLVRDNQLFLKTVGGLEKVNVLYRRTSGKGLDPIAFGHVRENGIPGLLNCLRKGTVAVANAFGTGVADNRALLHYSDEIIRFYLNETPILPSVPTTYCQDPDQAEDILSRADNMFLRPLHGYGLKEREAAGSENRSYLREMRSLLESRPDQVVAQPFVDASKAPRYQDGVFIALPCYLRAFVLHGDSPRVLPGGLTRQATSGKSPHYIADLAGGAKDTWIPQSGRLRAGPSRRALMKARKRAEDRDFKVTSRVGEHMYWTGRYLERAEHTSRMMRILMEAGWKQLTRPERKRLWPLWQGAVAISGNRSLSRGRGIPDEVLSIARDRMLNPEALSSVRWCMDMAFRNAGEIREFLTPEVWKALSALADDLKDTPQPNRISATRLQERGEWIDGEIAQVNGTFSRTMPHDEGWHCYRVGILLERAQGTSFLLEQVLPEFVRSANPARPIDPDLTTLLQMLGSLDAYQREYRSRTYLRQTADLLWKNREIPGAVAYCLQELDRHLSALESDRRLPTRRSPLALVYQLKREIQNISTGTLFPGRSLDADWIAADRQTQISRLAKKVSKCAEKIGQRLEKLHPLIEDAFFSHLIHHPSLARKNKQS